MSRAGYVRTLRSSAAALVLGLCTVGCPSPPSQFPDAASAIQRMRAAQSCSRGVRADAKLDYFEKGHRVRGSVLYKAVVPENLRFDVYSPFGVMLSTLSSDGRDFALYDLRQKQFLRGPANACNVARFTRVPLPPFALVQLLRGEAPVLVHEPRAASIEWSSWSKEYRIRIPSKHQAVEEISLEIVDQDWDKPWQEQRLRVTEVRVEQRGVELYAAELKDHQPAQTAPPRVDEDGLEPPVPPSGPPCTAELPRGIRINVPESSQDLVIRNEEIVHNPPLSAGDFAQTPPGGVPVRYARCNDR
jgi:hypothetical protein